MKLINETSCDNIPNDYNFANGLLYSIRNDSLKILLLPRVMPDGDTIAEEYIQMLTQYSTYENVYKESEAYGIELETFETMRKKLLKYSHLSNSNELFLRSDELFSIIANDNPLSQMLINMVNNNSMKNQTPPQSPRDLKCPDAPRKNYIKCKGCRMFAEGDGGENQESHTGPGGCLETNF
jgi:hypothetical protein